MADILKTIISKILSLFPIPKLNTKHIEAARLSREFARLVGEKKGD